MEDDMWIKEAIFNDVVVVELLIRMKGATPMECSTTPTIQRSSLQWGTRQRRSKSALRCAWKKAENEIITSCSPTTPLSWSADTASPSPTAEAASDDSSRSRSKGSASNEDGRRQTKKRMRRLSFSSLKRDEMCLLKERTFLCEEIDALSVTVREQRTMNERLRRMKIDRDLQTEKVDLKCEEEEDREEGEIKENFGVKDVISAPTSDEPFEKKFLLPDLNLLPTDGYLDF